MVIRWPQGREHGANVVAEELRRENLPIPSHHGGQSKRGEREPNEPGNQMRARLCQGLGALRLAFVVVRHVRSSKSRLQHCKPGRRKLPGCRNWRPSFLRPGCRGRSRQRGRKKTLGPSGARAQLGSSAAPPSWMTAWMLSTVKTVMQLRKQNLILRNQAKCH